MMRRAASARRVALDPARRARELPADRGIAQHAGQSLGIATGFERRYGVLKRLGSTPLSRGDAGFMSAQLVRADQRVRVQLALLSERGTVTALDRTRDAIATTELYKLGTELEDLLKNPGVDKNAEKPSMADLWKHPEMKNLGAEISEFRELHRMTTGLNILCRRDRDCRLGASGTSARRGPFSC